MTSDDNENTEIEIKQNSTLTDLAKAHGFVFPGQYDGFKTIGRGNAMSNGYKNDSEYSGSRKRKYTEDSKYFENNEGLNRNSNAYENTDTENRNVLQMDGYQDDDDWGIDDELMNNKKDNGKKNWSGQEDDEW